MGFKIKMVFKGFKKMKKIKRIFVTLYCIALKVIIFIAILLGINPQKKIKPTSDIILSFTSYGVRLKNCTWLAAYSMLMQTIKPEKIILCLDYSYKKIKLPYPIRKLQKMGITIEYCNDTRSYKKLIPAIKQYPTKIIITIDDDIYYSENLIRNLYEEHLKNTNNVCATVVRGLIFDEKRNPLPYTRWKRDITESDTQLFAVGYGGILYPPQAINTKYLQEEDFMKIAPSADDIWFFGARIKSGVNLVQANNYKIIYHPVNYLYERLHKNEGLTEQNVHEGKNDIQLRDTLKHFDITF